MLLFYCSSTREYRVVAYVFVHFTLGRYWPIPVIDVSGWYEYLVNTGDRPMPLCILLWVSTGHMIICCTREYRVGPMSCAFYSGWVLAIWFTVHGSADLSLCLRASYSGWVLAYTWVVLSRDLCLQAFYHWVRYWSIIIMLIWCYTEEY